MSKQQDVDRLHKRSIQVCQLMDSCRNISEDNYFDEIFKSLEEMLRKIVKNLNEILGVNDECPACRNKITLQEVDKRYYIWCKECDCYFGFGNYQTREEFIEKWNHLTTKTTNNA